MRGRRSDRALLLAALLLAGCARGAGEASDAPSSSRATPAVPVRAAPSVPSTAGPAVDPTDFFSERAAHPTVLAVHGPSPQAYSPWPKSGPMAVVEYPSAGRILRGLVARPSNEALARRGAHPALVYLHGGFALAPEDIGSCAPFLDAGFVVFAPALRGENGNPGDYELAFGELDDARAAVDYARALAGVDPSRVVVFGHSAGGMLSAMLALYPELPVVDTGSAGGLYPAGLFDALKRPFVDSPEERRLRLFLPYLAQLKHPHFACAGDLDVYPRRTAEQAQAQAAAFHVPLEAKVVAGNHFTGLPGCMSAYLSRVLPKVR
jgi:dienelactone hydrolase